MVTMASLSATSPLPGRRVWRSVPSFIDTDQTSCKGRQSSVPESCPPSLTPVLHPVLPVHLSSGTLTPWMRCPWRTTLNWVLTLLNRGLAFPL